MSTSIETKSSANHDEIKRLLHIANEYGRRDPYAGKRHNTRFHAPLQLEATLDCSDENNLFTITLHNISGLGIGFWMKQKFETHTDMYIREFSDLGLSKWIGARVNRCGYGLQGNLIGAVFHNPINIELNITLEDGVCDVIDGEASDTVDIDSEKQAKSGGILGWLGLGI